MWLQVAHNKGVRDRWAEVLIIVLVLEAGVGNRGKGPGGTRVGKPRDDKYARMCMFHCMCVAVCVHTNERIHPHMYVQLYATPLRDLPF